jgi:hypothetical protein
MTDEEMEIDNPCYHCYTGAIGECYGIGCKYVSYPWSGDLEADYKVEVEKGDVSE